MYRVREPDGSHTARGTVRAPTRARRGYAFAARTRPDGPGSLTAPRTHAAAFGGRERTRAERMPPAGEPAAGNARASAPRTARPRAASSPVKRPPHRARSCRVRTRAHPPSRAAPARRCVRVAAAAARRARTATAHPAPGRREVEAAARPGMALVRQLPVRVPAPDRRPETGRIGERTPRARLVRGPEPRRRSAGVRGRRPRRALSRLAPHAPRFVLRRGSAPERTRLDAGTERRPRAPRTHTSRPPGARCCPRPPPVRVRARTRRGKPPPAPLASRMPALFLRPALPRCVRPGPCGTRRRSVRSAATLRRERARLERTSRAGRARGGVAPHPMRDRPGRRRVPARRPSERTTSRQAGARSLLRAFRIARRRPRARARRPAGPPNRRARARRPATVRRVDPEKQRGRLRAARTHARRRRTQGCARSEGRPETTPPAHATETFGAPPRPRRTPPAFERTPRVSLARGCVQPPAAAPKQRTHAFASRDRRRCGNARPPRVVRGIPASRGEANRTHTPSPAARPAHPAATAPRRAAHLAPAGR